MCGGVPRSGRVRLGGKAGLGEAGGAPRREGEAGGVRAAQGAVTAAHASVASAAAAAAAALPAGPPTSKGRDSTKL